MDHRTRHTAPEIIFVRLVQSVTCDRKHGIVSTTPSWIRQHFPGLIQLRSSEVERRRVSPLEQRGLASTQQVSDRPPICGLDLVDVPIGTGA
jgi:hypothetical protein